MVKVSVIIPSLANEETYPHLKLCVESLRETVDWDIIVVTNGSFKPDLTDIHGITIHQHSNKQGQCNAVNRGVEVVNPATEYIMVSNDDMYYAPGWNDNMPKKMPLVWSPNLVEPENNPGSAHPFLKVDAGFTLEEFKKDTVDEFIKKQVDKDAEPGFNLPFFIKLEVWRTIGGYDERYDPWGSNSDTDLQTKINLAGITPVRFRDVLVYHFSNKSGTFDGTHQDSWQANWNYFDQKWGFNRDNLGSDVWYNRDMLPKDLDESIYQPDWRGKYLES